ncbi:acetyltransferase-like isoleucine patch superfamily enzyme [Acetoanaerobium pronyense]|uniref:Acetyltransferase-like isoleucine patch superfamily enzyme n=1 Tax=Acetoanaerobium pronyense TaxID=1482736 RepID=A0ABS4KKB5_9FIRM|nr:acyltransferase [Acetoanaerobium pronyense]MBP2027780.1 acetyltransferase-like isoleucine patch superfamily enzyme [Acetoanaerobium pronyense]
MNKELFEYINKSRIYMKDQYNRVLPTNELLYDRWDKAKLLGSGENTSIYDSSVIMGDVEIGKNVWIGPFTLIDGAHAKLIIGDFCHISSGVQIVTHDTVKYVLSSGKVPIESGNVSIGKNTYIGGMAIITKNVRIGNHCIIGANSLVNKDIPDFSIAYGTPAKIVGKVSFNREGKIELIYST